MSDAADRLYGRTTPSKLAKAQWGTPEYWARELRAQAKANGGRVQLSSGLVLELNDAERPGETVADRLYGGGK
jgi:hypothetical protein